MEESFESLISSVREWADDRDLLKKKNVSMQMLKVVEEVGETCAAIARGKKDKIVDGIGDSFVTLIILSYQLGIEPKACLAAAWDEIKERKGKTVNGSFIKDE